MSILATVDGEQIPAKTVETGYDLANQYGDELVVLHVMPQELFDDYHDANPAKIGALGPEWRYRDLPTTGDEPGEGTEPRRFSIQDGKHAARGLARRVVEQTLDDWEAITFVGLVGEPAEAIIEEAERRNPRFLVLAGRKRSPLDQALFGSTSHKILRNVSVPVVSVVRES